MASGMGLPAGLSRRRFLYGGAAGVLVVGSSAACDMSTEPESASQAGDVNGADRGSKPSQAPMLEEQVRAGKLPSLKKRMPTDPLIVKPLDRTGIYGEAWNTALLGPADTAWLQRTIGYEGLLRWDPGWSEPIPNVAKSVDASKDGREFVFILRDGMKWSDGEPFTAKDVDFALNDVLFNDSLFPEGAPDTFSSVDGTPATVEIIDEKTVRFTFSQPSGMFLRRLATPEGLAPAMYPEHHLKKFHADYNDKAAELAKDQNFDSWGQMFLAKSDHWSNTDCPVVFGWHLTTPLGKGTRVVAERNPYYWKTDPEGHQLPYLDAVDYAVISSEETILLRASHGDLDMHTRHIMTGKNKPVLARSRKKGGYHFFDVIPASMNEIVIMLNLTHRDKLMRAMFQDRNFRIGLSYAINREEIIKAVYQRQGKPWQAAPRPNSAYYDKEFAKQYTAYDTTKANEHLDAAGLSRRDSQGYRLRPDGERVAFTVEFRSGWITYPDAFQLIKGYWKEVGVDLTVRSMDRSLWVERVNANKHDATAAGGAGGLQDAILYGFYYLPFHAGSRFAIEWYYWYSTDGKDGMRPTAPARKQLKLYDQVLKTPDKKERQDLFRQVLQITKEQFWTIGVTLPDVSYGIAKNDFHNVPESMPGGYLYPTPAPTNPEQYYIDPSK